MGGYSKMVCQATVIWRLSWSWYLSTLTWVAFIFGFLLRAQLRLHLKCLHVASPCALDFLKHGSRLLRGSIWRKNWKTVCDMATETPDFSWLKQIQWAQPKFKLRETGWLLLMWRTAGTRTVEGCHVTVCQFLLFDALKSIYQPQYHKQESLVERCAR